jgi:hypothetical protein
LERLAACCECQRASCVDAPGQVLGPKTFVALAAAAGLSSIQFWMTLPLAALALPQRNLPAWQIGLPGGLPWLTLVLPWGEGSLRPGRDPFSRQYAAGSGEAARISTADKGNADVGW